MTDTPRARRVALAVAVVLATVAGGGVAAADTDRTTFVDAALDGKDNDWSAIAARTLAAQTGGLAKFIAKYTAEETEANASTYADDLRGELNQEAGDLQGYANAQFAASTDHDVFRVCTHDQDGGAATLYLVSNASNGSWANTRAVTPSEFKQLNRSVDANVSLDWYASRNADEEVDLFVDKFADGGEATNISQTYRAKKAAQYGDSVTTGLLGEAPSDCPT